jgi:hypothetical protein
VNETRPEDRTIRVTPTGILAGAFIKLVEDTKGGTAWWQNSAILSATGLAYHLQEMGYMVVPIPDDEPEPPR